jgi:hypothetical protein
VTCGGKDASQLLCRSDPPASSSPSKSHSLVRPAPRAFFHPDRQISQPPRAGGVKAGRHSARKARPAFPGRALTATEHGGILHRSGSQGPPPEPRRGGQFPTSATPTKPSARQTSDQELRTQSISRGVVLVEAEAQKQRETRRGPLLMEKAGGLERPIVGIVGRCAGLKGIGRLAVQLAILLVQLRGVV